MAVGSKLYVFGGIDGTSMLDGLFVLDNATNTWGKPDVFGDVPAPREGHSVSLIGDNLFVFGGYTFVWKKISTIGVSPIPRDSHTCSSYKNCFVVTGGEDGGNPETMAWWERLVFGRLRIPLVPGLLHVSPLQEIPWMQSEAYYSSMRDMLREKDPSEPKLSMRKELKRRRQKYRATPFVLDKQRDADKISRRLLSYSLKPGRKKSQEETTGRPKGRSKGQTHICEKIGEEKAARIIKQLDLKLDNILSKLNMCDKVVISTFRRYHHSKLEMGRKRKQKTVDAILEGDVIVANATGNQEFIPFTTNVEIFLETNMGKNNVCRICETGDVMPTGNTHGFVKNCSIKIDKL
ncbi:hypothetical protein SELMODRAFT_412211 [Selaginella moellendorffii]|uniref:Uncharacterized protein n=1 Tax=Selaginella moellendorffii TaxID=88036 RepID=D8RKF9_SELML|nr:hypothetical protein SELMODRAFT_412211 [Selaginella moellendorffii]